MSNDLWPVEGGARLGPAMRALSPMMRRFVYALLQTGCSNAKAAQLAGYSGGSKTWKSKGWALAHDARVQAAIHEEAQKLIRSTAVMAINVITDIAKNPEAENKDRLKAAVELLNRSGLHAQSEHRVVVEDRRTEQEMLTRIHVLAKGLGLDAEQLLGNAATALPAPAIDAEFEVVDLAGDYEDEGEGDDE